MGKRVGYEAQAASYGPDAWYALVVPVSTGGGEALALRHARAMKAVLVAARGWKRAVKAEDDVIAGGLEPGDLTRLRVHAEARLFVAQDRLERIEKEVSRG